MGLIIANVLTSINKHARHWSLCLLLSLTTLRANPLPSPVVSAWCPSDYAPISGPISVDQLKELLDNIAKEAGEIENLSMSTSADLNDIINNDGTSAWHPAIIDDLNVPVSTKLTSSNSQASLPEVLRTHASDLTEMTSFLQHIASSSLSLPSFLVSSLHEMHTRTRMLLCRMEDLYISQTTTTFYDGENTLTSSQQAYFESHTLYLVSTDAVYITHGNNAQHIQSDSFHVRQRL